MRLWWLRRRSRADDGHRAKAILPREVICWKLAPDDWSRWWDILRCGGQARTVSAVDVTAVRGSQLTYCVEVAAELLADVEEQTVRSVHQAQRPG